MRTTSAILSVTCALAAAGLTCGVVVERQARFKLEQENQAMQQQLSQMEALIAENQQWSNLLAQATSARSRPDEQLQALAATNEPAQELLRLRNEVEGLRQQNKEIQALREDTRQARAARESGLAQQTAGPGAQGNSGMAANGSQLEIVKAKYWTANTNLDVADALRERIRSDGLKAIASNNIKGDPEFGQVKHLTVVYRLGGITMTNEFREGDVVVLPPQ